ncbi:MAG: 1,4-dihydroxy-2-naphthoate polyprenyltransferase [Actinobacteria bacterium]|nr:1,4-dihydroxy-2-naphthoate polyprenyltransferase [Actinomycetota bacterium]
MTSVAQWVEGARPRTLGAAVAPVLVGTAAASTVTEVIWWRAGAALVVALALQVGVNYANDYSDGVRGTDADRRGPLRLTASGVATPGAVRAAAFGCFGLAAAVGLALALAADPWLLVLGAGAIGAAWCYTGGPRPYGYSGLGEVAVLAFFGFGACAGSAYVQALEVPAAAWWGSLVVGLPACAVLLANNIRDAQSDAKAGKRTLAVRMGTAAASRLFVACLAGAFLAVVPIGARHHPALLALAALPLAIHPSLLVLTRTDAPSLVSALVATVRVEMGLAILLSLGLALA